MAIIQVPIVKGKGVVEFDTDALPEAVFAEAILQGLKTLVNRGMSKITVKDLGSSAEVEKEAMICAMQNHAKIMVGDVKLSGKAKAATAKMDKAVLTEALRIARDRVRDALKAAGKKLYAIKAADITSAAKDLINIDPSIIEAAQAAIKARNETPVSIDLSALIGAVREDGAKIAKAEAEKVAKKADKPLSAAQAGKVKGRKPATKPVHVADKASQHHATH